MELFYRKTGTGPNMVILHGLYGSSDNWLTVCKLLENSFEIFIPDQRNHGKSPHSSEFDYDFLSEDIIQFIQAKKLNKIILIGHSMGGKVAMHLARKYPEVISHLILVDIAPKNYFPDESKESFLHIGILEALQKLYLPSLKSRDEADSLLSVDLPDKKLRSFLLKNLKRTSNGNYSWLLNIEAIQKNFSEISEGFRFSDWENIEISGFPVLFVKGEKSNYIEKTDIPLIKKIFPAAEIIEIPKTGHWLHAENSEEFASIVKKFVFG